MANDWNCLVLFSMSTHTAKATPRGRFGRPLGKVPEVGMVCDLWVYKVKYSLYHEYRLMLVKVAFGSEFSATTESISPHSLAHKSTKTRGKGSPVATSLKALRMDTNHDQIIKTFMMMAKTIKEPPTIPLFHNHE